VDKVGAYTDEGSDIAIPQRRRARQRLAMHEHAQAAELAHVHIHFLICSARIAVLQRAHLQGEGLLSLLGRLPGSYGLLLAHDAAWYHIGDRRPVRILLQAYGIDREVGADLLVVGDVLAGITQGELVTAPLVAAEV